MDVLNVHSTRGLSVLNLYPIFCVNLSYHLKNIPLFFSWGQNSPLFPCFIERSWKGTIKQDPCFQCFNLKNIPFFSVFINKHRKQISYGVGSLRSIISISTGFPLLSADETSPFPVFSRFKSQFSRLVLNEFSCII